MSIVVECPNPDCGKTHRVKNSWAGRRGTCPDCGAVIEVPVPEGTPMPRPKAPNARKPKLAPEQVAEETVAWGAEEAGVEVSEEVGEAVADDPFSTSLEESPVRKLPASAIEDDPFSTALPDEQAPVKPANKKKPNPLDEEAVIEEAEGEPTEEEPAEAATPKLSRFTVATFLLGALALGGMASVPYLPGRHVVLPEAAKALVKIPEYPNTILEERKLFVVAIFGGLGALALVGLIAGTISGRFGVFSLVILYLLEAVTIFALFVSAMLYLEQMNEKRIATKNASPLGALTYDLGIDVFVAIGLAAAATLLFAVTALRIHRRTWARIVFAVLVLALLGLGALGLMQEIEKQGESSSRRAALPLPTAAQHRTGAWQESSLG